MDNREAETCLTILRYMSANPEKGQNEMIRETGLSDRTYVEKCLDAMRRGKLIKKERDSYHSQKVINKLLGPSKILLRDIDSIRNCVYAFNTFEAERIEIFHGLFTDENIRESGKVAILKSRGFPKEQANSWSDHYQAFFRVASYCAEIAIDLIITQFMVAFVAFKTIPIARRILLFVFVEELTKLLVPQYSDDQEADRRNAIGIGIRRQEVLSATFVNEVLAEFRKSEILQNPLLADKACAMLLAIDKLTVYGGNTVREKLAILNKWQVDSVSAKEKEIIKNWIQEIGRNFGSD